MTYWIYKQSNILDEKFQEWIKLNWLYDLSFFLDYYPSENIIKIEDWDRLIPNNKLNTDYRLFKIEHNFEWNWLQEYLQNLPWNFDFTIKTIEEIKEWIDTNTTLEKIQDWEYLIYNSYIDELEWEIPAKYLIIAI